MFLTRLFRRTQPSDGASPALETAATGISPGFLDGAAAAEREPAPAGRRDRAQGGGDDALLQAVSAKILHGWLQNRHQTLYPLTLNFRVLRAEQSRVVAHMLATSLLCARPGAAVDLSAKPARVWLTSLGADAATVAAFDTALDHTPPLHAVLEQVIAQDVAVYAYVAGLIAADPRYPAGARYLDYLQAWLELPTSIVRSASRRYGR
jgi:hypothetical protein